MQRLFILAAAVALTGGPAGAADEGPVYTDPAEAGPDYAFQGEYRGWQRSQANHRSSTSIGLQVIGRGDGKFEAVKYYGGLPGAGWHGGERFVMSGEITGDVAMLRGDQYDIMLEGPAAVIFTHDGRRAGELQRVERISPTLGAAPPEGAVVLFDGEDNGTLKNLQMTEDGLLLPGVETVRPYQNFRLHGEFRLPYQPQATGQARGNSGFYLQGRYEVQVLDSFGLEGVDNECGALYKTRPPLINMCLPPLQWQTYDIDFTAPEFDAAGHKIRNMRISVWHNGVLIHDNAEIPRKTGGGTIESSQPQPIKIQDHNNPVRFRNLWIIDTTTTPTTEDWLKLPLKAPPVPIAAREPRGGAGEFVGI